MKNIDIERQKEIEAEAERLLEEREKRKKEVEAEAERLLDERANRSVRQMFGGCIGCMILPVVIFLIAGMFGALGSC